MHWSGNWCMGLLLRYPTKSSARSSLSASQALPYAHRAFALGPLHPRLQATPAPSKVCMLSQVAEASLLCPHTEAREDSQMGARANADAAAGEHTI